MTLDKMETGSPSLQAAGSKRATLWYCAAILSASALLWTTTAVAQSLPNGGTVAAGQVKIKQPNANTLNINQGSNAAIVNWSGFSIGSGSTVNIQQPGKNSVILNRVTGDTTSQIHGQMNANGKVHLVNPNGIVIGPNGHVNAAGFVASTLDISDDDFLNGRYRYAGDGASAAVENAGTISIVPGGYAALIGGKVTNSGLIQVPLGKVGLGAGEKVTLDVSGDGFLQVAVPSDTTMEDLVTNSGRIEADGGVVHLKAASARNAARQVINMSGVIEARSVSGVSGAVVLGGSGGGVQISGKIDTSARKAELTRSPRPRVRSPDGGTITVTGEAIKLAGATLKANGAGAGDGGTILVGGDFQGGGSLQTAHTTTVDANSKIVANGGTRGDGGRIIVWSDYLTKFHGDISARGGAEAGDGGFAEVSGKIDLIYRGFADLRAPNGRIGELLLDPINVTVPGTISEAVLEGQLASADVTLTTSGTGPDAGNITINADIDWTSATDLILIADNAITLNGAITAPSGGLVLTALGAVDGLGLITTGAGGDVNVGTFSLLAGFWRQISTNLPSFAASDFAINPSANFLRVTGGNGSGSNPYSLTDVYGLQGIGGSQLSSLNFELANNIDASATSTWFRGFEPMNFSGTLEGNRFAIDGLFINDTFNAAGLFNVLSGTVRNLSITNADVSVGEGGILAAVNDGTVSGVMTSGTLFSGGYAPSGGLVGENSGTIIDSFSTAAVDVIPIESDTVITGGLVGRNTGSIIRSHSTGSVTGSASLTYVMGGLVGENFSLIRDSYSTSSVTGGNSLAPSTSPANFGGLVGSNSGTITRTYATGPVSFSGANVSPRLGGLVGANTGSVNASFWNRNTTGQSSSAGGGTSLTTRQLQNTQTFYRLASAQGWNFRTNWAPGTGSTNPANYTTSPVVFAIPNSMVVPTGATSTATATGTVYGGPSVYLFGPASDTLNTASAFQSPNFASTSPGTTSFTLSSSNLVSSGGVNYAVASLPGVAVIGGTTTIIPVPPTPTVTITPTVDTTITGGGGGGTAVTTVAEAEAALGTVENASQDFDSDVSSCASSGENVSEYLSCLAEAMDDYAEDLDEIVDGLPPGLESVGDIIRGASAGIREAGETANRRLALATTAEERAAIRRDAVQQARREIQQAQREIRKAITLIRATDPELVIIQNQQVETIVAAVGQAEISLTRAIGL